MCFLDSFLYCIHLYYGCIIIGISGLVVSIVACVVCILAADPNKPEVLLLVLFFIFLYFMAKVFLLLGAIYGYCNLLLISFAFGLVSLIFPFASSTSCIFKGGDPISVLLGYIFVLVEIYFACVVISFWNVCRNCCASMAK